MLKDHGRYDYSPITGRADYTGPVANGLRSISA